MKIHAIETGTVALTTSWREGVGHGKRRLLNTLLDRSGPSRCRSTPSRSSILPSHDPDTAIRLAERRTVGAVRQRAAA